MGNNLETQKGTMKKINRFMNPFLHGAIIDVIGYTCAMWVLWKYHGLQNYLLPSMGLCAILVIVMLLRGLFTSTSLSMLSSLRTLRIILYNINSDILTVRLYMRVFGRKKLYKKRVQLLLKKKTRAKNAYKSLVRLVEILWSEGYNTNALLFALNAMVLITNEINSLNSDYRQKQKA